MQVSRFSEGSSIEGRIAGFMEHLRHNGIPAGIGETETALRAMENIDALKADELRLALASICATNHERHERFDDLFNAYWFSRGLVRERNADAGSPAQKRRDVGTTNTTSAELTASGGGRPDMPDEDGDGDAETGADGRLVAARLENLRKTDLRHLVSREDIEEAEKIAYRIARSFKDRRSRRRKAARHGADLDMRRIVRASISHGGEPIELFRRKRPERPVRLSVILDVSGSMMIYSRIFLAFLRGLAGSGIETRAYLLHTRLQCVTDALREGETLNAVGRLSLMASGIGGGTKIGENLQSFNAQYARNTVNGRSVVMILSDGYDTGEPELVGSALQRLRKRGCRIIWLNPLKGWKDYQPVARGMAAALPFLDLFAAANTLESFEKLESEFSRL